MIKLLPCPFCGGEAGVVKTQKYGRYIECWDCGGRTEEAETDYAGSALDKVITAWNCRTQQEIGKRGKWILVDQLKNPFDTLLEEKCSLCGRYVTRYDTQPQDNFCPNCGAKMEEN